MQWPILINIIGKTNNWNKLLQINDQSLKFKIINRKIYEGTINYPENDSKIFIEDNVGEDLAIHIHLGLGPQGKCNIRLHFTYEEFEEFCNYVFEAGER